MNNQALDHITYAEYLQTPHWLRIREAMLWLAGYRCQICKSQKALEVHHASGYSCLGNETPDDLVVLCRRCHQLYSEADKV